MKNPLDRRRFLASMIACPACASAALAQSPLPHWEYDGARGAENWGQLDNRFQACAVGSQQSPIDLKGAVRADVGGLDIRWEPQPFEVVNNGHTIQANAEAGSRLTLGRTAYELKQFHFHTPSEHAFDGRRTAMEAHFVHAASDGKLAVVGVLMTAGKKHDAFAEIMKAAPKREGEAKLRRPINARSFLPEAREFFRYEGSLTTPPCSETVNWNVLRSTIEVAASDIDTFKGLFPMNARPLQAANRRFLLRNR
ncbi:carbonic anhydrase family protein [Phreatobacter sp.]|uniref:carbonic anhydrase n=1 Tax=Phreatobacter sp. TaxID=1966341 RepID=UPI0022C62663|nr:carbonic anhydrase family protein [Phreatobacter sp.]MCZ8315832.1 carbonic anhydrase family protein [Phreatobacter sp.]